MKSPIVIALWDSNQFLMQGMRQVLKTYFHMKGVSVIFIPLTRACVVDSIKTDLIAKRMVDWDSVGYKRHKMVITRNDMLLGSWQGEFNLCEKPEVMIRLLDELFAPTPPEHLRFNLGHTKISAREIEVLRGIATELTPYQIAKNMQISIKTVSGHKHAAMRKLGFKRTHELYNWLLQSSIILDEKKPYGLI
ncbi:helix-turn-helix transcriptional regulator [Serratia oryzae]|uniref:HTH luxR-type domain-containing protein n=1 Tax=Serratia oryzae TaxID=2034155 RepID=A0A1S8CDB9_9GAMM|nr:LuxR C-terminal-related transcriptional regulator [Serratia oryzae]OMQ18954.1 hypothetical protein BMI79_21575 [Serratia oryzae]